MMNEDDYKWLGQSKISNIGGIRLPSHIQDIMYAKPSNYVHYFMKLGSGEMVITITPSKQKRR